MASSDFLLPPTVIAAALPDWIRTGDSDTRQALADSLLLSEHFQSLLVARLGAIVSAEQYCRPVLEAAVRERFGLVLDPRHHWLERGVVQARWQPGQPLFRPEFTDYQFVRQSLLEAAMHNFEASKAPVHLSEHWPDPTTPDQVIEFCRTVDLGRQYQAYLVECFDTPHGGTTLVSLMRRSLRHDLQVSLQEARLKGRLPVPLYQALGAMAQGHRVEWVQGHALRCLRLSLLDVPLTEVLAFEVRKRIPVGLAMAVTDILDVVLYIPGDPQGAVSHYPDWDAAMSGLRGRLEDPAYVQLIAGFVPRWALAHWQQRLAHRMQVGALLGFDTIPVEGHCLDAVCQWRRERMLEDARMTAVPTDALDQEERARRLALAEEIGLDLLGLAAFVVPGLGAVMLGVGAEQLMAVAYEGFEDWQQGDRDEAWQCLAQVVGEVALGAAAGGSVAAAGRFVAGLRVLGREGSHRLWHADLETYRQPAPAGLAQARYEQGIYRLGEQAYVSIDQGWYRVEAGTEGQWHLIHPRRSEAYRPPLLFDGAHAWRMEAEDVAAWPQDASLVRRFGGDAARLTDEQIDRLLDVTGLGWDALRTWHEQRVPPSALFEEIARRLRLDARLTELSSQAADPEERALAFERLAVEQVPAGDEGLESLQHDFPGLSAQACRRLVDDALPADRVRLRNEARVPLQLACAAHRLLRELNLARRMEAYYFAHGDPQGVPIEVSRQEVGLARQRLQAAATLFRLPRRTHGRIGYRLGRASSLPLTPRGMARQLREVYPDLAEREAEALLAPYRSDPLAFLHMLDRRREALRLLRIQLREWVDSTDRSIPLLQDVRQAFSTALIRGWQRLSRRIYGADGQVRYSLTLEHYRVGSLPTLDTRIEFDHVAELWLSDNDLSVVPTAFLGRFPDLQILDISRNSLQRLPDLSRYSNLSVLRAGRNQLQLDAGAELMLGRLENLRHLDLSHNTLQAPLRLDGFPALRLLRLRLAGLDRLPEGLEDCLQLEEADLRDNRIARLPEPLFERPSLLERVFLDGNPLERHSLERLQALHEDMYDLGPLFDDVLSARQYWTASDERRQALWDEVVRPPEADELYRILNRLRATPEARLRREELTERVWWLLEQAHRSPLLRAKLYAMPGDEINCDDSILSAWTKLHEAGLLHEALMAGMDETGGQARLTLARGLFRLRWLEQLAVEDAHRRGLGRESIEVSLAYRIRLAEVLELPGQPRHMLFGSLARLDDDLLAKAQTAVTQAERSEAWPIFLAQQGFWRDYLEERYPERFRALAETFQGQEQVLEVDAQALMKAYEAQREQLLMGLSEQELHRLQAQAPRPGPSSVP